MDLDLGNAHTRLTAHQTRIARAERMGILRSTDGATTAPSRPSILAVPLVGRLLRTIGEALDRAGDLPFDSRESLRSDEQRLAELGLRWTNDAAADAALANELRAARQRRLAARPIEAPISPTPRQPRRSSFLGGARRVSLQAPAVGGLGQAGD